MYVPGQVACSYGRPIAGSKLVVVDLLHLAAGPLGTKDAHDLRSELPISAGLPRVRQLIVREPDGVARYAPMSSTVLALGIVGLVTVAVVAFH